MKVGCQDKREIDRLKRWLHLSKIIHYLKEQENEEGGFSFAIDLYPDIEDIYYATRIFQLLNGDILSLPLLLGPKFCNRISPTLQAASD